MTKPKTTDERMKELEEAAHQAYRDHFKPMPELIPGCIVLDVDVRLDAFERTLHAGAYFTSPDDKDAKLFVIDAAEMAASMEAETLRMEEAGLLESVELEDGGVATRPTPGSDGGPIQFAVNLTTIALPKHDGPLTLFEACAWCAMNQAEASGNTIKALRLFRTLYGLTAQDDVTAIPPQRIALLDKTARNLSTYELNDARLKDEDKKGFEIDVTGANEKTQRIVKVALSLKGAKTSETLTPYEQEVCNALMSFYHNDPRQTFTTATAWRVVTGLTRKPKPKDLRELDATIDRLRGVDMDTDITDELRRRGVDEETMKRVVRKDRLLPLAVTTFTHPGGKVSTAYSWTSEPILYWHNRIAYPDKRQMTTYPVALLQAVAGNRRMDEDAVVVTNYVIVRVREIQNQHSRKSQRKNYNRIRLDTVLEHAGKSTENRTTRGHMRKLVESVLETLRDKGEIKGYSLVVDDRSSQIRGYDIEV